MEALTESRLRELEGMHEKAMADFEPLQEFGQNTLESWDVQDFSSGMIPSISAYASAALNAFPALAAAARKGLQAEKYRNLVIELLDATPDDGCWASVDGSDFDKIDNILAKLAALTTQAITDGGTGG